MKKNYNENLVAGAAIRDDKGRRISKLFEAPHPKMTVGYARNLIMPSDPEEQEFNFRQSGGGVIEDGVAVIDKVKGNSVVWNQLFDGTTLKASGTSNGITFTYENGVITANGTATNNSFSDQALGQQKIKLIKGHKYIFAEKTSNENAYVQLYTGETEEGFLSIALTNKAFEIQTCDYTSSGSYADGWLIRVRVASGTTLTNAKFRMPFTDLTQMFGAGNEPSTYEEFLQRKPFVEDEYAYNEGTIVNNKVEGCRTVGFNQFNPNVETEYLSVTGESGSERYVKRLKALPGTYFIKSINNEIVYTKSVINGVYGSASRLNDNVKITLNSYGEIWIYTNTADLINSVANDICINLSDPTINGKYFPYEKHELDLSWVKDIKNTEGVKLFEDGLKSAGTAFDEVGKNKAVKRMGVKVFDGTEAFGRVQFSGSFWYFRLDVSTWGTIVKSQYLCNKYVYKGAGTSLLNEDKTIASYYSNTLCLIRDDSFENVDSFKQHLAELHAAGTPLVVYYELAESIEVEYDEKSLTYPVVAGGTEEAIASESSSAFRADIGYGIDAVKTILDLKARVEALEGK